MSVSAWSRQSVECKICGRAFFSADELLEHAESEHPEKTKEEVFE